MDSTGPDFFDIHVTDLLEAMAYRDALCLPPGTLTEVIAHGDYYHRRDVEAGHSVSAEELERFVGDSPYMRRLRPDALDRMLSEINATGQTELGWSTFYLESPRSRGKEQRSLTSHGC